MPRNKRPQDREEKRDEIVAVARRLFIDEGYEVTPMGRIAAGAEIAPNTIYWYFRDKDDVLLAVLDEVLAEATREFLAQPPADLADRLLWLVDRLESVSKLISTVHSRVALSDAVSTWHDFFHTSSEALLRVELSSAGVGGEDVDDVVKVWVFAIEGLLMHGLDADRKRSICRTLVRQLERIQT
ncbi:TetR/AcrR family transcriptional regulator [Antrihabitans sp. YC2-6]|uniref:TetR/AcrR family transcriptional regulator n=1 Tax=Antrihabitans sp. YC2-6 TaxID=2799498 RepID=UPI0018F72F5E|nr:TetR/AcrR family transcriptional regulator [Antrihabitans sp. YC2-6]MBJ8344539.1 TetR/AcrR family transcriptional regulator [Antrihabitans sp. YC2-6]